MKDVTQDILGYEDFFYTHHLDTVWVPRKSKNSVEKLCQKTGQHLVGKYHLSDEIEAFIRSALWQAYLLGKKR